VFIATQLNSTRRRVELCRYKHPFRYDIREYYFTGRIVNMWNSLPDAVVNSSAVNQFKNRLDRHWSRQEMMYNYKAELAEILSRRYI